MANQKTDKTKVAAGIGAGVALIAAGIGTYFLYGTKEGQKRRKKIQGWVLKAKGEVLEQVEKLKEVNQEKYDEVVDRVINRYKGLKHVDAEEAETLAKEMKAYWRHIDRHLQGKSHANGTTSKTSARTKTQKEG